MACIVYYTNSKTGAVSAYRSEAKWDPEKGYSVPKRTYLGRADPITHEIFPSSHKRGRPALKHAEDQDDSQYWAQLEAAKQQNQTLQQEIDDLRKKSNALEKRHNEVVRALTTIQQQLNKVLSKE